MYSDVIYISVILLAFVCQANGNTFVIESKNKSGGSQANATKYIIETKTGNGGSKFAEKSNLNGGSDYMAGDTKSSETCPPGFFGKPPGCSCFEDNTAYVGYNIKLQSINPFYNLQPSRMACQKFCSDYPKCEFWTWAKRTGLYSEGHCYLRHTRANWTHKTRHYVSGSKHCLLPEAKATDIDETEKNDKIDTTAEHFLLSLLNKGDFDKFKKLQWGNKKEVLEKVKPILLKITEMLQTISVVLVEVDNDAGRLKNVTTNMIESIEVDTKKKKKKETHKKAAKEYLLSQLNKEDFDIFQKLPNEKKEKVFTQFGNILETNGKSGKDYQDLEKKVHLFLHKVIKMAQSSK